MEGVGEQHTPILTGLLGAGIGKEDGKEIIHKLGYTLLHEHEKLFRCYFRNTFEPPSSLLHLLGKGISVLAPYGRLGGSGDGEQHNSGDAPTVKYSPS